MPGACGHFRLSSIFRIRIAVAAGLALHVVLWLPGSAAAEAAAPPEARLQYLENEVELLRSQLAKLDPDGGRTAALDASASGSTSGAEGRSLEEILGRLALELASMAPELIFELLVLAIIGFILYLVSKRSSVPEKPGKVQKVFLDPAPIAGRLAGCQSPGTRSAGGAAAAAAPAAKAEAAAKGVAAAPNKVAEQPETAVSEQVAAPSTPPSTAGKEAPLLVVPPFGPPPGLSHPAHCAATVQDAESVEPICDSIAPEDTDEQTPVQAPLVAAAKGEAKIEVDEADVDKAQEFAEKEEEEEEAEKDTRQSVELVAEIGPATEEPAAAAAVAPSPAGQEPTAQQPRSKRPQKPQTAAYAPQSAPATATKEVPAATKETAQASGVGLCLQRLCSKVWRRGKQSDDEFEAFSTRPSKKKARQEARQQQVETQLDPQQRQQSSKQGKRGRKGAQPLKPSCAGAAVRRGSGDSSGRPAWRSLRLPCSWPFMVAIGAMLTVTFGRHGVKLSENLAAAGSGLEASGSWRAKQDTLAALRAEKGRLSLKLALLELRKFQAEALEALKEVSEQGCGAEGVNKLEGYVKDSIQLHEALSEVSSEDFPQVEESLKSLSGTWMRALELHRRRTRQRSLGTCAAAADEANTQDAEAVEAAIA